MTFGLWRGVGNLFCVSHLIIWYTTRNSRYDMIFFEEKRGPLKAALFDFSHSCVM